MRQDLTVLSVWPRTIVADLRAHGRSVERILDEAGLDLRSINREGGRIPWQAQATLMEIAARELADDCYGIHLAAKVDIRDADALAYIGLASHTLGEALANLARYVHVFNEVVRFTFAVEDDLGVLGLSPADPSILSFRQQMEFGAGLLLHFYRLLTKRRVTPVEIRFVHGRRKQIREVSRYFGCKVKYLESGSQIALRARDIAIPIDTADYRLLKILMAYREAVLKQRAMGEPGLLQKLEHRIIDLLPKGAAKAKVIAIDLGISERTLTRRLAALGTNFKDELDGIRKQLALKYLDDAELSLAQIAFVLGYANQPAFTAAFKRWTGKAPREHRR